MKKAELIEAVLNRREAILVARGDDSTDILKDRKFVKATLITLTKEALKNRLLSRVTDLRRLSIRGVDP